MSEDRDGDQEGKESKLQGDVLRKDFRFDPSFQQSKQLLELLLQDFSNHIHANSLPDEADLTSNLVPWPDPIR